MKIALDTSPLKNNNRFRGVGSYTRSLAAALKEFGPENKYFLTSVPPENVDLIHYPFFTPFFATLPWHHPCPFVVTIHDLIPLRYPQHFPPGFRGRLKFFYQRAAARRAAAVITDSQASRTDLINFLGLSPSRVFPIYLAPEKHFRPLEDKKFLKSVSSKYSLPPRFVLYVGDVNYNKNVLGLARACASLRAHLVIVGKQAAAGDFDRRHPENRFLITLLDEFGSNPLVHRLGFVPDDDLVAVYNLAAVYCQPSFWEGFCLPVLEAMACGTPVVAAETPCLREVAGQAAVFAPPSPEGLAKKLKQILASSGVAALTRAGLERVKSFSWQKTALETLKVYEQCLKK